MTAQAPRALHALAGDESDARLDGGEQEQVEEREQQEPAGQQHDVDHAAQPLGS